MAKNFTFMGAGLSLLPIAGDATSPANGDIWYNSIANRFRKFENGVISDLAAPDAAPQAIRYVDSINGSDSNSGSIVSPMQTVMAAITSLVTAGVSNTNIGVVQLTPGYFQLGGSDVIPPFIMVAGAVGATGYEIPAPTYLYCNNGTPQPIAVHFGASGGDVFLVNITDRDPVGNSSGIAVTSQLSTTIGYSELNLVTCRINGGISWSGVGSNNDFLEIFNDSVIAGGTINSVGVDAIGGATLRGTWNITDTAGNGGAYLYAMSTVIPGTINFTSTSAGSYVYLVNSYASGHFTLTGATASISADADSKPSSLTLNSGATLELLTPASAIANDSSVPGISVKDALNYNAHPTVYYIDADVGNDSTGTGTYQNPFATINAAQTARLVADPTQSKPFFFEISGQVQEVSTGTASLVVQDLTYAAVTAGAPGIAVSIAYTTGGTAGSEVVSVSGNAISVQIAAGVSTATQIQTAVQASAPATALATVSVSGTGSNPQNAPFGPQHLLGAGFIFLNVNLMTILGRGDSMSNWGVDDGGPIQFLYNSSWSAGYFDIEIQNISLFSNGTNTNSALSFDYTANNPYMVVELSNIVANTLTTLGGGAGQLEIANNCSFTGLVTVSKANSVNIFNSTFNQGIDVSNIGAGNGITWIYNSHISNQLGIHSTRVDVFGGLIDCNSQGSNVVTVDDAGFSGSSGWGGDSVLRCRGTTFLNAPGMTVAGATGPVTLQLTSCDPEGSTITSSDANSTIQLDGVSASGATLALSGGAVLQLTEVASSISNDSNWVGQSTTDALNSIYAMIQPIVNGAYVPGNLSINGNGQDGGGSGFNITGQSGTLNFDVAGQTWLNFNQGNSVLQIAANVQFLPGTNGGGVDFGNQIVTSIAQIQTSQGGTTGFAVGSNSGSGAAGGLQGGSTDLAGNINITTGTGSSAGAMAVVTYASAFPNASFVTVTPSNANAASSLIGVWVTGSTTGFTLNFSGAPIDGTSYSFNYHVIGF